MLPWWAPELEPDHDGTAGGAPLAQPDSAAPPFPVPTVRSQLSLRIVAFDGS